MIYVGVLEEKNDPTIAATTLDISPDGGTTWSLTDQAVNTGLNISALTVSDLRIRFNLKRAATANIWTVKTSLNRARTRGGAGRLTSDLGLSYAGENVANAGQDNPALTDRYSQTANTWTTINSGGFTPSRLLANLDLTSDMVLGCCPNNPTYMRFSNAALAWISRTAGPNANGNFGGASFTSDLGCISQPHAANLINTRYSDSANSWTARNPSGDTGASYTPGAASLNTDLFVQGSNATVWIRRFSDSANAWTTRVSMLWGLNFAYDGMASLTSDSVIHGSGQLNASAKYFDSANMCVARSGYPNLHGGFPGMFAQTNNSVMQVGGDSVAYVNRYTDGEHSFKGFAIK